jgi:nicotinic acid mononucleotide adenylyltransferase
MKGRYISPHTVQQLRHIQTLLDQLSPEAAPRAFIVPGSPEPRDAIIVFPGSFNPPTKAHLALLKQAQRFAREHEPMYLYAATSKHTVDKETVERPLLVDRIHLLEVVLKRRLPHAGIMLFNRGLYVEEAEAIRNSFPKVKRILFLVGFDKIVQILDPRYYENRDAALTELFKLAELLVAPRGDAGEHELAELLHQPQNARFAHYIHRLPFNGQYRYVSSTNIRQGTDLQDAPQEVRQFIHETRAYAPPLRRRNGSEIDYYGQRIKQLERDVLSSTPKTNSQIR